MEPESRGHGAFITAFRQPTSLNIIKYQSKLLTAIHIPRLCFPKLWIRRVTSALLRHFRSSTERELIFSIYSMPNPRKRSAPDTSGDPARMARTKKRNSVPQNTIQSQSDYEILLKAAEILQSKNHLSSNGVVDALRNAASGSPFQSIGDTSAIRQESTTSFPNISTSGPLGSHNASINSSDQSRAQEGSKSPPTSEDSIPIHQSEGWPEWQDLGAEWPTFEPIPMALENSNGVRQMNFHEVPRHAHMMEAFSRQDFQGSSVFPTNTGIGQHRHSAALPRPASMMLLNDPILAAASVMPMVVDMDQSTADLTSATDGFIASEMGGWEDVGDSPPSALVPRRKAEPALGWERETGRRFPEFSDQAYAATTTITTERFVEIELPLNGSSLPTSGRAHGRFESEEKRQETCNTRKNGACLRCKMQRIRCEPDPDNKEGECKTCKEVSKDSKQIIHTLPCLRYKLTESVLYRRGHIEAQPRLKWSNRWATIKMTEITEWDSPELKTIQIKLDLCPEPFVAVARKFTPVEGDVLQRKWTDGKIRKHKDVPPYAIANMKETAVRMARWITEKADSAIGGYLCEMESLTRETYDMARTYAASALPLEDRKIVRQTLELWFAIRQTTKSEFLVGKETLGMEPELSDKSYPLFGKIPVPPVLGLQIDIMLTLNVMIPLRKQVLDGLHQMTLSNRPKSWLTMYLCVFVLLHNSSLMTAWCYDYARKHGLKERYAYPRVVEDLHHGANTLLAHFHYCNKGQHLPSLRLKERHDTVLAELSVLDYQFMIRIIEIVKLKEDEFKAIKDYELYESELYFVSQMFEKNWMPRDSYVSPV